MRRLTRGGGALAVALVVAGLLLPAVPASAAVTAPSVLADSGNRPAAEAWLEAGLSAFPDDSVLQRLRADLTVGAA